MTAQEEEKNQPNPAELPAALADAPQLAPPIPSEPAVASVQQFRFGDLHSEFANFHEAYVRHYIALADTKAGVIFTLAAGIIGFLIGKDDFQDTILAPACASKFVISFAALLLFGAIATLAFLVIAPRLSAPSKEGLIFFGAVARKPNSGQYVREIAASTEHEITEARLGHCYDTAKICARKYELLKAAIWLLPPGLLFALVTQLLS